ncbi:MAG: glycosyltransferase family 2 protein [Lentisphaerae bacterium]|nr:glycosyltransferase family 2 protein [Lentisphaerota bacterium]MCP4102761.1 glycosyltransferase family 2 protein [Lentisphaerota bacterium]
MSKNDLIPVMSESVVMSVVLPTYNEEKNIVKVLDSMYYQKTDNGIFDRNLYEIIIVDNNSTDNTIELVTDYLLKHDDLNLCITEEKKQGVAWARKTGMDLASKRSHQRDFRTEQVQPLYICSADADCKVDETWLFHLKQTMDDTKAAIGVCNYYYPKEHFCQREKLWTVIEQILRARDVTFKIFGGFPDGKGFAATRECYDKIDGIEIFYQLKNGKFLCHLSDDWDFGIKARAMGFDIVYSPDSKVEINPRRVDNEIDRTINGLSYGEDGIITMRDIRPLQPKESNSDLTKIEARTMWEYAIKDFTPKNIILPLMLTTDFFKNDDVIAFLGDEFAAKLEKRIAEIKQEMSVKNFAPIHLYKTPSFRLYMEFKDELFEVMRTHIGEDVGHAPPLPPCLQEIEKHDELNLKDFIYYYCEDRESGEAHNYFGNGGVF